MRTRCLEAADRGGRVESNLRKLAVTGVSAEVRPAAVPHDEPSYGAGVPGTRAVPNLYCVILNAVKKSVRLCALVFGITCQDECVSSADREAVGVPVAKLSRPHAGSIPAVHNRESTSHDTQGNVVLRATLAIPAVAVIQSACTRSRPIRS